MFLQNIYRILVLNRTLQKILKYSISFMAILCSMLVLIHKNFLGNKKNLLLPFLDLLNNTSSISFL